MSFARIASALLALTMLLAVSSARADDLTDFEQARALYERRNYVGAATAFRAMVGSDPPRVGERLLVLESRKYLAASLLFLGQRDEARSQFRLLLAQEPDYALDPLSFPTEMVSTFEQVKADVSAQLAAQREAERAQREAAQRRADEEVKAERENLARLFKLATEAETATTNSRFIASIPFGVGQIQNGHKNFGIALAILEGIAATTSVATYIGHQRVADDRPAPEDVTETGRIESLWRTTNIASFSAFAVLAVIGIVDAHVRFVPARVTSRPRPLSPELERWREEHKLLVNGFKLTF